MFEPVENRMAFTPAISENTSDAIIKVVGVGGGGGNAINHMCVSADEIKGVEFYDVNTDAQVLKTRATRQTIQIGANTTKGLGAGADPAVGRQAAEEDRDALASMLAGANMTFIAVGMGGGTGTGAAPVVASIAKELNSLTVGVVTKPFRFEGPRRMRLAEQGIQELAQSVDSLIIIPNDKLRSLGKSTTVVDAFAAANDVLRNCVLGITNMITSSGGPTGADINVDFADVRTVMSKKGYAMIGVGFAEGSADEGRAEKAMNEAITSPLLENVEISGAKGMLISINAGTDFLLEEVYSMMDLVYAQADEDAPVVFGCNYYPEMDGRVKVTLVATGIGEQMNAVPPKVPPVQTSTNQAYSSGSYSPSFANPTNNAFNGAMPNQAQPAPQQPEPHRPSSINTDALWKVPGFMNNGHN